MIRRATLALLCFVSIASPALAADDDDKKVCLDSFVDAQRLRAEKHLIDAREALRRCSRDVCPKVASGPCTTWLVEVEAAIPRLSVDVRDAHGKSVSGARITIDGKAVSPEPDGTIALDPGTHAVRVERAGFEPAKQSVELVEGPKKIAVQLTETAPAPATSVAPSPPAETSSGGGNVLPYVLGGVGVVALGSFAYFGLHGRSGQHDLESTCSPRCPVSDQDPIRRDYLIADVSLGVGLVSLGAATWLFLRSHDSSDEPPSTSQVFVSPLPGGAAAGWSGVLP